MPLAAPTRRSEHGRAAALEVARVGRQCASDDPRRQKPVPAEPRGAAARGHRRERLPMAHHGPPSRRHASARPWTWHPEDCGRTPGLRDGMQQGCALQYRKRPEVPLERKYDRLGQNGGWLLILRAIGHAVPSVPLPKSTNQRRSEPDVHASGAAQVMCTTVVHPSTSRRSPQHVTLVEGEHHAAKRGSGSLDLRRSIGE